MSHTLLGDLAQKTADEIAAQLPNRPDFCPSCGKPTTGTINAPAKPNVMELAAQKYLAERKDSSKNDWDKIDFNAFAKELTSNYKNDVDEEYLTMSAEDFESRV